MDKYRQIEILAYNIPAEYITQENAAALASKITSELEQELWDYIPEGVEFDTRYVAV